MGNDKYIGDGVYLSHDGYQLWLAANHHENKVVAIEPQVFINLIAAGMKMFAEIYVDEEIEKMREEIEKRIRKQGVIGS